MTKPVVHLPDHLRRQIIDHCLAELPNEACGLLAVSQGQVVAVYPTSNVDASPTSYTVSPKDHYTALTEAESRGWDIGGVYHSHPNGSATMSATDLERALEPDWLYVVVGMAGSGPELGVWTS